MQLTEYVNASKSFIHCIPYLHPVPYRAQTWWICMYQSKQTPFLTFSGKLYEFVPFIFNQSTPIQIGKCASSTKCEKEPSK